MRNLKKFLALVMAMVMAMSLMITADAKIVNSTDFGDEGSVIAEFDEAVAVLTGMGIIKGDGGNFRPSDTITRAEVAALLYRVISTDVNDTQTPLYKDVKTDFVDIPDGAWYEGYVGYLWNAKIIKGIDPTHFNPKGNVTGYEVLAMILRAIGYDKNNEFTGGTWQITVSSLAQQEGLLTDVDKTNYNASTLWQNARRDVVASLLFCGMTKTPMVVWNSALSYQKTGMVTGVNGTGGVASTRVNPTLGQRNFGLECRTGIIVANQATGESNTRLSETVTVSYDASGRATGYNIGGVSYEYLTSNTTNGNPITPASGVGTSTGSFATTYGIETDLRLFGHKVNMWYDNRKQASGSQTIDDGTTTYANLLTGYTKAYVAYDLATIDKYVFAETSEMDDVNPSGDNSIFTAAKNAGFSKNSSDVYVSDRYSRMAKVTTSKPTLLNLAGTAIDSEIGTYRLISNGGDTYDVIIPIAQEVAKITQVNTSAATGDYIFLGKGNSGFGDPLGTGVTDQGGKIAVSRLAPKSVKTLGTLVTATEILGTTKDYATRSAAGADGWDKWTYYTEAMTPAFTGTISTYGLTNIDPALVSHVTLSSTESYSLSGITGSTNPWGSAFAGDGVDAYGNYGHVIDGALTVLTSTNTYAGVSYSFYVDVAGRFIGVGVPNDYTFLYTTYVDYDMGALGTGTIGYYAYGVDWDGNMVTTNNKISSITLPLDWTTNPNLPVFGGSGINPDITFDLPTSVFHYAFEGNIANSARSLSIGYNLMPVTRKDQGSSWALGNQVAEGANTRFMIDPNGNLDWFAQGGQYGNRFIGWYNDTVGVNSYSWSINSTDAANGFVRVKNQTNNAMPSANNGRGPWTIGINNTAAENIDYLLTNQTEFIVVTGSGTADLAVQKYTGLKDLLAGSTGLEITSNVLGGDDNIYFLTSSDEYGNADMSKNHTITKVIMSDKNLKRYSSNSLYFAVPGAEAQSFVNLAGSAASGRNIKQYKLYNNGVAGYYWIDEDVSYDRSGNTLTVAGSQIGTVNEGDFYTLAKIDTINGQPIYRATNVTGENNAVQSKYNYVAVNYMNTAEIGNATPSGAVKGGLPVDISPAKVFNVTGATVTQDLGNNGTNILTNEINTLEKLNQAVAKFDTSGNTTELYDVTVAIVFDGVNVSCIYVTNVQPGT